MPDEMKADQDWKDQARAEKERLSKELDAEGQGKRELPEASFMALLSQMGLQTAIYLGDMPNPVTGKPDVDLAAAKYHIDMLGVLQEKTQGNLSAEEEAEFKQMLTGLRMRFVSASANPPPESAGEAKAESKIITP